MRRSLPFLLFALAAATALWLSARPDRGRHAPTQVDVSAPPPAAPQQGSSVQGSSVWPPPSDVVLPRREIRTLAPPASAPAAAPAPGPLEKQEREIAEAIPAEAIPEEVRSIEPSDFDDFHANPVSAPQMPVPVSATPRGDSGMPPLHPISRRAPPTPPPVIAFGAPVPPIVDPTPPVQEKQRIGTNTGLVMGFTHDSLNGVGLDSGDLELVLKIQTDTDDLMRRERQAAESFGTSSSSSGSDAPN